jgi:predicted unusual protein kinase regulating ubiquinone biosynthesis (AarF/ABC1/UbiB family)
MRSVLDVGITSVHSEADHRLLSDVLASFIRKDGRKAAGFMIDNSNAMLKSVGDKAIDEEEFTRKIENITIEAAGENYFMQNLG